MAAFFALNERSIFMAIHFNRERMAQALDAHARWWKGTLDRPLVSVTLHNAHPCVNPSSPAPVLNQASCTDLRWSAEQVIDAMDDHLSTLEFMGDAFPFVNFSAFGPGVLAALCGAKLDNSNGAVWFWPDEERGIADIHVRYNPDNVWVRRIKDLYRAGLEKWNGCVILGMPDLGGVMDVAATFRGSENLLLDLYDSPEEVLRLNREIQTAWYDAYNDFASVLAPQHCYTDWSGLLSPDPSYILQSDFCYMIGNPMFRQFVLPTLQEDVETLTNTIYHLDGIGELNHLDDVLSLDKLNAVQWVFGDGKPGGLHWLDVYKKIQASGKRMWIVGTPRNYLDVLGEIHGTPYGTFGLDISDLALAGTLIDAR